MQRWECFSDMLAGAIDGMKDGLAGVPRASNANRSHSYSLAYGDAYAGAITRKAKPRDRVAEELAIKADMYPSGPVMADDHPF
jgi:hypothetical protein